MTPKHAPTPIIVTRSEPGARQTCQRLAQDGYFALASPALELVLNSEIDIPPTETLSGLIFTSANGVRFFSEKSPERDLPTWCVGPATAEAARQWGFQTVHQSSGNALQLAEFILARGGRSPKPLAHIANDAAAGKLAARLELGQQRTVFIPLYTTLPAQKLSISVTKTLEAGLAAIVMAHSAKAALAFAYLARELPINNLHGVAISEQAAQPLETLGLKHITLADHPDEDGMFRALKKAYTDLST